MTRVAVVAHSRKSFGGGLAELRKLLAEHGHDDPLWYEADKSRKIPKQVRRALDDGAQLLFVWGGDGTIQRCIDTLKSDEPVLAILPAGTANLLASNLGIPKDLPGAVQIGLHGADRHLDVGRVNGERFGMMAGAGFDGRMIADADRGMKDRVGRAAYMWTGLRASRSTRQRVEVDVDGRDSWFAGRASCVLLGNFGSLIGGIEAFDSALPDDGQLEVAVITAEGPIQWARLAGRAVLGHPRRSRLVRMTRGRDIDIRLEHKTPYELDGGARPPTKRLLASVEPRAITVRVRRREDR